MARGNPYYARLGEQITRLVQSLVAVKGWSMATAMNYVGSQTGYSPDMIHRWRQGRSRPSDETLETLARIGKQEAGLDREWGESLLRAARYADVVKVVDDLWGPREIRSIPCNLPPLGPTDFVGRRHELDNLLELLSPEVGAHIITVDGIGGVGKTTLVLVAAHRCWKASTGEDHTS